MRQDERLYLAAPADMLAVIRELGGSARHLMVFGHNPGITDFANRLSAGDQHRQHADMRRCSPPPSTIEDWSELDWGSGRGREFDYPKNLA